ncbi:MAG: hypothetical protein F6K56_44900 [Moorea sp. SIO3G5]|nr:hypothetical protein [Moorena sp. SIO3G5]
MIIFVPCSLFPVSRSAVPFPIVARAKHRVYDLIKSKEIMVAQMLCPSISRLRGSCQEIGDRRQKTVTIIDDNSIKKILLQEV